MEQEGIYYYFFHEQGKCTIVLCDSRSKHDPYENFGSINFATDTRGSAISGRITEWTVEKIVRSGKFAHIDYDFEKPGTSLMSNEEDQKSHARADYEIYDYPGEYLEKTDGDRYAKVRMEELAHSHERCTGGSDAGGICTGSLFTLNRHTRRDQNREYLVTSTDYHVAAESYETSGGTGQRCTCFFSVIPGSVQFRQARVTPKPIIQGSQTAVVVGPPDEEIHTDEHGRVKVQFHWDREGSRNQNSSCWIRVASTFAGGNYGAIFMPRIGQEVLVNFIEGDPDRPIITGRVYNADNMPPYSLPDEKTKSTIKTNSSIGGQGFNEIRFEDRKGEEQLFIRAEKDLEVRAQNDHKMIVQNESHLIVQADQVEKVEGEKHLTVNGDHNEKVDGTISIEAGQDLQEKVGGKHALDAGQEIHLTAGMKVIVEGSTQISLKVGGNFIDIGPAGVTIQGTVVNINSGGSAGSGSGCSPQSPREPLEADEAQVGRDPDLSAIQAQVLESAAESGTPFCEQCQGSAG